MSLQQNKPRPDAAPPVGILICNTGTPNSPSPDDIRPYLSEFLMDPAIISMPRALWKPILKHFILPKRPLKSAQRYERIWTPEGSPFMFISFSQRDKLQAELLARGCNVKVALGMRYGNPSLECALQELESAGCTRIICAPLFPQEAKVTTGTIKTRVNELATAHPMLQIEYALGYYKEPAYLDALAQSICDSWEYKPGRKLLFSYHSTLVRDINSGDPYQDQALETAHAVAQRLGIPPQDYAVSYQCRFDSRKWLMPSPETVLKEWAQADIRNVAVVTPVFSADCIETLVDCDVEQRELFAEATLAQEAPSKESPSKEPPSYTYIPALNDSPAFITMLASFIEKRL